MKLTKRQLAALRVVVGQHTTRPGSMVLHLALGMRYVGRTLRSLVAQGMIEEGEFSGSRGYRATEAGKEAAK